MILAPLDESLHLTFAAITDPVFIVAGNKT